MNLNILADLITDTYIDLGLSFDLAVYAKNISIVILIFILSLFANFLAKKVFVNVIGKIVKRTKNSWDDALFERGVIDNIAHLAPALVVYYLLPLSIKQWDFWVNVVENICRIFMIIVVLRAIISFLKGVHDIYSKSEISKTKPIKGYIQIVNILLYIIAIILIISIIIGKSPMYLLTGLGAMTAILLLVFKDTIMGLVASIQLSANDMVRPGDWVSMSKYGADGTVLEINLATVKIQNWDKTISTVPTYSFISDAFQNWRGMEESGGRRIKRSISLDMNSVKFCTSEMIEKFKTFDLITEYVTKTEEKVLKYNSEKGYHSSILVNGIRQTNLGVFRKYLENYLSLNENINKEMTFLVRQLSPTETGIPIEIYVFSKIKDWAPYEAIQADIFDHILAVIPEFELSVFQNPTGVDFKNVVK